MYQFYFSYSLKQTTIESRLSELTLTKLTSDIEKKTNKPNLHRTSVIKETKYKFKLVINFYSALTHLRCAVPTLL